MKNEKIFPSFDFTFDTSLDIFGEEIEKDDSNPYEEEPLFLENTEGRSEFLPPDPERVPVIEQSIDTYSEEYASRPALERTRELFGSMAPHRATLIGILQAATSPIATSEIESALNTIEGRKFSVYSPSNYCTMLETAGALTRIGVRQEGNTESSEEISQAPEIVTVEGVEYYKPAPVVSYLWLTSDAGRTFITSEDSAERISALLKSEDEYVAIYKRILTLTSDPDGASMAQLSTAVDTDPTVSDNRRFFVQHFVEALEQTGAIMWKDEAWHATEDGEVALANNLANVVDDYEIPDTPNLVDMPTTSQGVNW